MSLASEIKKGHSKVFRRCYIKRRLASTGLFESNWVEITDDVKKWGSYRISVDSIHANKFTFANASLVMANDQGKYNPSDDETSLWYNYLDQQRTLVRIEAGFVSEEKTNGVWERLTYPDNTDWDDGSEWDQENAAYDTDSAMFTGIISGDITLSNKNEVTFTIKPLTSVFIDYAAKNLTGWTSTGMTASQFMTMLRDQTDGSGNYVFRPFFGDTTSYWDISTTSNVFSALNTATSAEVIDKNCWQVIEKLAEAENFLPFVTRNGTFKFVSRDANTSTVAFEFHGSGSYSGEYGHTIKSIERFGRKITKYYSRVSVKFRDEDTSSAYSIRQAELQVSPINNPWNLGQKTLNVENFLLQTSTVADVIAQELFDEYSAVKNEIAFTTSFIPNLEISDRISISYDSVPTTQNSLWDLNNWADDATSTASDLTFEVATGDAIRLLDDEFKFLSIDVNLDKFETKFEAREI